MDFKKLKLTLKSYYINSLRYFYIILWHKLKSKIVGNSKDKMYLIIRNKEHVMVNLLRVFCVVYNLKIYK